jgi:hypothetical protein
MATKASAKVVDFSNVKEGGGSFNKHRIPSGDYPCKILKVEDAESKSDGGFQYLFTLQPLKFSQYKYPYYCKLQENQLWKLRNLLVAAGITVPKKRMKLDPSKVVGKIVGVTFEDDEYEGRMQSSIASIFPASELDADDIPDSDDEDEPEAAVDEDDDMEDEVEEEAEEGDEFDDMDRTALKAYIKADNPAVKILKSMTDDDLRDMARDIEPAADEEADDEEDEEEEPEPEPEPKKKSKKKAKAKKAELDDDDLEDLDISDL